MTNFIPYGRQSISQEDIDEVVRVLQSDWLTQGPMVSTFEQALCDYTGTKHASVVANGTAALHCAYSALGIGAGDVVWTTANTFVASANAARYCGAEVDFIDIDPQTRNLCVKALEEKLAVAKKASCLPKLVVPVHFAGLSCKMAEIKALADTYGFAVIEDASHAIGGQYQTNNIGCSDYSDMTIFSFHPVKIMTTGEGGAVITNNPELHARVQLFRAHGVTRECAQMQGEPDGPWDYQQISLGYNYRITDIQCALGLSQIKRVDDSVAARNRLALRYHSELSDLPIKLPLISDDSLNALHLYVIEVDASVRTELFELLRREEIGVNVHYKPVYLQPYYQALGFKKGHCPNAEAYYQSAITLPLFPALTQAEQDKVITLLKDYFR